MQDENGLYQLVYHSRSALTGSRAAVESEVASILERSRRNNEEEGVSGALMFTASVFIQVLEGSCADVERAFERICCDVRHIAVELVSLAPVPARSFSRWHMHRVVADEVIEAMVLQLDDRSVKLECNAAETVSKVVSHMSAIAGLGLEHAPPTLKLAPSSPQERLRGEPQVVATGQTVIEVARKREDAVD